jgi:hypothetical protein
VHGLDDLVGIDALRRDASSTSASPDRQIQPTAKLTRQ